MTLREVHHLTKQATINAAINQAVTQLPVIAAARSGSTPDDSGVAGYSVEDEDEVLVYTGWFSAGDMPDEKLVRPY